MGRIGLKVAEMMSALGSKRVVYSKRNRLGKEGQFSSVASSFVSDSLTSICFDLGRCLGVVEAKTFKHLPFEELIAQSDIIVLTVPLSPETHHLLDAKVRASSSLFLPLLVQS